MNSERQPWDDFFMSLAETYAKQSTCKRAHVGCVIVSGNRQIGAGFNGPISGDEHCKNPLVCVENDHCKRAMHAELNAVLQAMRLAPDMVPSSTAYVTHYPCIDCYKVLAQVGVARVVYLNDYRIDLGVQKLRERKQDCPVLEKYDRTK